MKTTTKEYLVGTAFALGSQMIYWTFAIVFYRLKFSNLGVFFMILIALFSIPVYFICKQDRSWRYSVTVAITHLIAILPYAVWISYLGFFASIALVGYLYFLSVAVFLPPVIDWIIAGSKTFYHWLGERESRR